MTRPSRAVGPAKADPAEPDAARQRAREHEERLRRLRLLLESRRANAAVLSTRRNIAWLTAGGAAHVVQASEAAAAAVLVTREDVVLLTANIEASRIADEELAGLDIEVAAVPWWEPDALDIEVQRRVGSGQRAVPDAELETDLVPIRSILSGFDRDRMRTLGSEVAAAMDAALAAARPGTSENELVADLLGRLPGVRAPVVLAAADDRIARYRHPLPGDRAIRARVMLVLVAERFGLHVALTRIREFEAPDAELSRRLEGVDAVQAAMHDATRPGVTVGAVFEVARSAYAAAGYADEWRDHHQGGSIGYQARERIAVPGDLTVIQPGMALAWNPSIAGAKAEATLVLDGDVAHVITAAPALSPR